jgi:outer membrane protein TolC
MEPSRLLIAALDLGALLASAEAANPEILAARSRSRASEHASSQAQAPPDPLVAVAYTNDTIEEFTLGSSPDTVLELSWTQEVRYPGKRSLTGDVVRADVAVLRHDLEALRLGVLSEVKQAYVALLRLDRTRTILEGSRELLESFRESARRRYEGGEGILENVLKAQTELTRLEVEMAVVAQERSSVAAALNALVGRREEAPVGPAVVPPVTLAADRESLQAAALERSPQVLALRAATEREGARLDLARHEVKPDFMWRAAYMNRGGLDPMVSGMFGVRLPLYRERKQAAAIVQSGHEHDAARHELEAAELRVLSAVRDLVARADRARLEMQLYAEGVIPQSQSALDSAAASYTVGRTEFVTLIGDFLSVLDAQLQHEVQRAEYVAALAALEPLTGAVLVLPGGAE